MGDYKRLTKRDKEFGIIAMCPACSKNATCKEQGECVACVDEVYEHLCELEDKIENGTLIEVDNKVYPPNKSIGVWGDYCSKCGGLIGENGYEENYCSHCGAKLKDQENER